MKYEGETSNGLPIFHPPFHEQGVVFLAVIV